MWEFNKFEWYHVLSSNSPKCKNVHKIYNPKATLIVSLKESASLEAFAIPEWLDEDMILPLKSLVFKEILGRGNFGVVQRADIKHGRSM